MDLWRIAVRALIAYAFLLTLTRASGKRVISQATPFDLLVSLIVGDLIDDLLWAEVSLAKFAVAAGTIALLELFVEMICFRSRWFLRLVNGTPREVIRDGCEDRDALRREQLNEGDLAHLMRLDGFEHWKDVHLAFMERDHEISVIRYRSAEPATKAEAEKAKERFG